MCPTNFCSVQPVATPGRVLSALPKCRHPSTHKNAAYARLLLHQTPRYRLRESAPGESRGPAAPVPRPPRCAEPRARRYVGMIVRIRRSRCGSRAGERRASPVDRRTSLSHELQRPCGPKRHKPFSRNSENMPILAIQGVAVKEKRRAFQLHGAARLRRPPRALRVLPSG